MNTDNMSFLGHLEEFRRRLIVCLIALLVGILIVSPYSSRILAFLKRPAGDSLGKLAYFAPAEAFSAYFMIAFFGGLILAMPVILYQVWAFFSPAISAKIRRYAIGFVAAGSLSFAGGCVFAYSMLLPAALKFLLTIGKDDLEPVISVSKYISFALSIIFCTGLVFEMPVVSLILARGGMLDHRFMRRKFKYAVLLIFIVAAIITPTPDVFNMTLLALPMLGLYEVSIWVAAAAKRR
ncbi:MAG: twin-arginine translocase subunit TatC [Candidatus Omnitrophota bacterium]